MLLLAAGGADAGPWPRVDGDVFLSFSGERDASGNGYAGLYGEYGLTPRSTLGFEFGRSSAGETGALVWLQRALDRGEGPDRWTASLGLGVIERDGTLLPVGQIGTAWGRGFDALPILSRIPGGGWVGVETRLKVAGAMRDAAAMQQLPPDAGTLAWLTPEMESKGELTLGWNATPAMTLIAQLRLEDRDDTGFSSKLATSLVRDLGGPARLELGVVTPLSGAGERAVRLGTWLEF